MCVLSSRPSSQSDGQPAGQSNAWTPSPVAIRPSVRSDSDYANRKIKRW